MSNTPPKVLARKSDVTRFVAAVDRLLTAAEQAKAARDALVSDSASRAKKAGAVAPKSAKKKSG